MSNALFIPKVELSEITKDLILWEKLVNESKGKNKLKRIPNQINYKKLQ